MKSADNMFDKHRRRDLWITKEPPTNGRFDSRYPLTSAFVHPCYLVNGCFSENTEELLALLWFSFVFKQACHGLDVGMGAIAIAKELGIGRATVYKSLKA